MYEYLVGRIAERGATHLVLEVGGVGYELHVPLGSDFKKRGESGDDVLVWTHFVVREDAQQLYGFPDRERRELFRLLLKVRGVGPQLAQAILSSMSEEELLATIASGDSKPLTKIKGVGKKTADQILLDLRDRAPAPSASDVLVPQAPADVARDAKLADAIGALISIGYSDKQAKTSVERAAKRTGTDDLEELVRAALRE